MLQWLHGKQQQQTPDITYTRYSPRMTAYVFMYFLYMDYIISHLFRLYNLILADAQSIYRYNRTPSRDQNPVIKLRFSAISIDLD